MGLSRKPADTKLRARSAAKTAPAASVSTSASSSGSKQSSDGSREPTLYATMVAQHHQIDQLLSRITQAVEQMTSKADRVAVQRLLSRLRKTLFGHISLEDGLLFREFEAQSGLLLDGPTATLRREHQVLKARIDELTSELAQGAPIPVLRRHLDAFSALYGDHCHREDVLYGICERLLSPEMLAKAQTLLRRKPPRSSE